MIGIYYCQLGFDVYESTRSSNGIFVLSVELIPDQVPIYLWFQLSLALSSPQRTWQYMSTITSVILSSRILSIAQNL